MTVEAIWNDQVIAHSDRTVVVEGNHYFPREDVDTSVLEKSATTSVCPWKGTAQLLHASRSMANATKMPRGTIPTPSQPRPRSRTGSRSGTASKFGEV